ncbi:DUF1573 domain-containing protein [Ferruginibacter profundus]
MLTQVKRKSFSFCVGVLLITVSCQSNIKNLANISFDSDTLKFERININDSLELEYKFKNNGTANLKILDIGVECGCTKPTYDTFSYLPGVRGKIKLKFLSSGDTGKVIRTIVVKTNSEPSLKVLYLIGRVY